MTGITSHGTNWKRWRVAAWAAIPAVLLAPLVAMQFTEEVDWTVFDFIFVAVALSAGLLLLELTVRMTRDSAYRAGAAVAVGTALLLVWVTGAVGIIGTENNDANLMFGAVLAVAVVGSIAGRVRADGMMRAFVATAVVQAAVGVIAIAGRMGDADPNWPADVAGLTVLFTGLWLLAAWLFRRAAAPARALQ
ncbi:MAG TPA: hypothetical protein VNM91_12215 [Dehalococcoidia bacterium]|nr:hypothetical protein [Dehalococcoidia bacterium]